MPDCFTKEKRSEVMSKIKSKNTKAELILRKFLWKNKLRYMLHQNLPGKPDIVFKSKKVAIFVDGCFWHKCPKCYKEPKSNKKYWIPKINKNVKRDKANNLKLKKDGWKVLRFWEHEIKKDLDSVSKKIIKQL